MTRPNRGTVVFCSLAVTVGGWAMNPALLSAQAPEVQVINRTMTEYVARGRASGVVTLVARGGKVVHLAAVGKADLAAGRTMRTDAIFRIASMTKPITATAVLICQDDGKLSVSDPVSKYIPEFKDVTVKGAKVARPVTIRDLMTHTSGVSHPRGVKGAAEEPTLAEIAVGIARAPLGFQPGSRWSYSSGVTVCGRIIEVVSGKAYDAFLRERIFRPLGMKDTAFVLTKAQAKRVALMYEPGPKGKEKAIAASPRFAASDPTRPRTPGPSGGLFSTAADMGRFYQAILNGGELGGVRIVSAAAVRQMTTLQTGELKTGFTPGNGWGLGWCLVRKPQGVTSMLSPGTFGHGGAFGTQGWVDPQRGMIFVLMIQRVQFGNSDGSQIRGAFQQAAVDALCPKPSPAGRKLTWRRTKTSIALLADGRVVWQHVHNRKLGKPYMRFGLGDGTELTRPWPIPKGYARGDHRWHRALWWSWKAIGGVNYWEGNQQGTEPVEAKVTANDDGSAAIRLKIAYHQPGKAPVAMEARQIDVTAPDAGGSYLIRWRAIFTPAGKDDVVFNRNSYGGFALRLAAECCGDPAAGKPAWTFVDSEKRKDSNGRTARWVAYHGTAANGQPVTVAVFDHPANPRHPSLWQTRAHYPYLNPSFTCRQAYTLKAGKTLTLTYGVRVHQGAFAAGAIERAWRQFADSPRAR